MANSTFMQTNFVSGELSPLLKGRTDLDQYYAGCETAANVLIVPQGGLKRRAGTAFIDEPTKQLTPLASNFITATMPNGGTAANLNDFNRSTFGITTTNIGTTANYEVVKYVINSSFYDKLKFVNIKDIKLTIDNSDFDTFTVQVSANNTTWTDIGSMSVNSEFASYQFKIPDNFSTAYVRIIRLGTKDLTTQKIQLSEFNVLQIFLYQTYEQPSEVKTFEFSIATDRHYLCVATGGAGLIYSNSNGSMAFYRIPHAGSTVTTFVGNVPLPYSSQAIPELRAAQTENVMLLFHPEYPSKRIINTFLNSVDSFFIDNIPYSNVPQYDYNDSLSPTPSNDVQRLTFSSGFKSGDTYQIDVEGVLSKNITYVGGGSSNQQNSTIFNLQKNLQEMPVFGETGVDVTFVSGNIYDITISGESTKDFELFSGFPTAGTASNQVGFVKTANGVPRKEDVWSAVRGYPKMGAFHEGRLWLGGAKSKQQSLFASKSGSFFDFFFEEGDDDEGMFITITSKNLTTIVGINSDRGLQVFTAGAEFLVKGSTPTTVAIESQTQHGSSNLEAKSIDGATLFVDQNGKSIRQFVYSFNEDAYTSNDISVLSSHLIKQPIDLAVLTGTTSEDSSWVFIINTDGTASILNTVRAQDINGFTQFISANSGQLSDGAAIPKDVFSASVVNNDLFLVNRYRATTGTPYTYSIEKWDFDRLLDASIILGNVSATTVSLGTSHFNNATVSVIGSGNNLDKRTVSNTGTITLTTNELSGGPLNLEVGLNFVPTVKPMPLNTNMGKGQNAMKQKKITNMNFRFYESAGIYIDGNPSPIRQMTTFYNTFAFLINSGTPVVGNSYSVNGATYFANSFVGAILTATRTSGRGALPASGNLIGTPNLTYLSVDATNSPLGEPFEIRTGIIEDNNGGNGWGIDVAPLITVPDAAPFHIQAIQYEVESS